jgi:hypothetical protein
MEILNAYELRARVVPAIAVALPLGITLYTILSISQQTSSQLYQFVTSGVVLLVLVYLFSFVVRHNGKKVEPKLWLSWGGPPSTRVMRWRDSTIGENIKQQIHTATERICGVKLSSKEEEAKDAQMADSLIMEAFSLVKAFVRKYNPEGLWDVQNAEYGFHRNLTGCRWLWLIFSLIGTLTCGVLWYIYRDNTLLIGLVLNFLLLISALILGWSLLPKFAKASADRYAESVWTMFLAAANSEKK